MLRYAYQDRIREAQRTAHAMSTLAIREARFLPYLRMYPCANLSAYHSSSSSRPRPQAPKGRLASPKFTHQDVKERSENTTVQQLLSHPGDWRLASPLSNLSLYPSRRLWNARRQTPITTSRHQDRRCCTWNNCIRLSFIGGSSHFYSSPSPSCRRRNSKTDPPTIKSRASRPKTRDGICW